MERIIVMHDDLTDVVSDLQNAGVYSLIYSVKYGNRGNVIVMTEDLDDIEFQDVMDTLYDNYGREYVTYE